MALPKRKKNRLEGYDYSSCGAYFITVCVADRNVSLWDAGVERTDSIRPDGMPPLSGIGKTVDAEIQKLSRIYETVTVDNYCIMPDHVHLLLSIVPDARAQIEGGRTQFAPTASRIIKQFKGSITKQIGLQIWQKSFYDRIVRNEQAYREAWQYIDENPLKWKIVKNESY